MYSVCRRWSVRWCVATGVFVAGTPDAQALSMDYELSVRSTQWSSDRQLNNLGGVWDNALWAQTRVSGPAGELVFKGVVDEPTRSTGHRNFQTRELLFQQNLGRLDLAYGRKIIAWGKADGLNPVDVVSPKRFTQLSPSDADLRYGRDGLHLKTALSFNSDKETNSDGLLSVSIVTGGASHELPVTIPEGGLLSRQLASGSPDIALKLDKTWRTPGHYALDTSLMAYRGADLFADLRISSLSATQAAAQLLNRRQTVLGADASVVIGSTVWRGEFAASRPITDASGHAAVLDFQKRPAYGFVGGPEFRLSEHATLGVQVALKFVDGFESVSQRLSGLPSALQSGLLPAAQLQSAMADQSHPVRRGGTLRWASQWYDEQFTTELAVVALWPDRSGIGRANLQYKPSDRWAWEVGAEGFYGPGSTFFGLLKRNNLIYLQTRYQLM